VTMRPAEFEVQLFSRRDALRVGGAAAVATGIAGCDQLVLPPMEMIDEVSPLTPQEEFYIQHCCGTPDIDPATFSMEIRHGDTVLATIDRDFVEGLVARTREHTLQCIGARPRFLFISNALWLGLPFQEVLNIAINGDATVPYVVPDDVVEMRFTCEDGYYENLPPSDLEDGGDDDVGPLWLVWGMNDEELSVIHGAPFRFLTPGRYGTQNPKWVHTLEFATELSTGYWAEESRGSWSDEARYLTNGMILSPPNMSPLGRDTIRVVGAAFAGKRGVTRVEITTDERATWTDAEITYQGDPGSHVWTLWRYDWVLDAPGEYTVQCRVTDEDGNTSNLDPSGTDGKSGYNGGMAITVRVS
jgi:DMSO/TMAO reductase YedYZ molybdopterin-dependent catalytic subunit